jgi:carbamoyl-phosphate synthase/aspartate carbamoyltransferase
MTSTLDKKAISVLHVLSSSQFTREQINVLFANSRKVKLALEQGGVLDLARGKLLGTMFFEPSTRTTLSFTVAMKRLGGLVVAFQSEGSSMAKGETAQDSALCMSQYVDAIVLRHPEQGMVQMISELLPDTPVINAGNGSGEHPTQALLDLFTISMERPSLLNKACNPATVLTFCNDLRYSRCIHSLIPLLCLFQVGQVNLVSSTELALPAHFIEQLTKANSPVNVTSDLHAVLPSTDVLYMTRLQKERFNDATLYERAKSCYQVSQYVLQEAKAKEDLLILHPLPRNTEIHQDIDTDVRRCGYFKQMKHGMVLRAAILCQVLKLPL